MNIIRVVGLFLMAVYLAACGGGGGGSSNSGGPGGSGGGGNTGGQYSLTLDRDTVKLDIFWDRSSTTQVVKVNFKGDGLIVGYPPGVIDDSFITVDIQNMTATSADVVIGFASGTRFEEKITFSRNIRVITGKEDGSQIVYKDIQVILEQHDGISVAENLPYFSGIWGEPSAVNEFIIETFDLNWTITSDLPGLRVNPSSGRGRQEVSLTYDYMETPVTTTNALLTITASDGSVFERNIGFSLESPLLRPIQQEIELNAPQLAQQKQRIEVPIILQHEWHNLELDLNLPWSAVLPDWLSADQIEGVTGFDALVVFVNEDMLPDEEGSYTDEILLQVDIPGAPLQANIPVTLIYNKFRLQADRQAFSFSDYGTSDIHTGVLSLNAATADHGEPLMIQIEAESNQSWLVIDSKDIAEVKFHVDAAGLAAGFHLAEITVSAVDNASVVPDKISVGYYKKDTPVGEGSVLPVSDNIHSAVSDRLGPWIYFAELDNEISIFNVAEGVMEQGFSADTESAFSSLVVSDDGKFLYALSYANRIYVFDLITRTPVTSHDIPFEPIGGSVTEFHYHNIDNKPLLRVGNVFIDANTGDHLVVNHYYFGGSLGSFGRNQFYTCFIDSGEQFRLRYDYARQEIRITGQEPLPEDFCLGSIRKLASDGKSLSVYRDRSQGSVGMSVSYLYAIGQYNDETSRLVLQGSIDFGEKEVKWAGLTSHHTQAFGTWEYHWSGGYLSLLIYDRDLSLLETVPLVDDERFMGWFLLSSDDKFLTYVSGTYSFEGVSASINVKAMP